MIKKEKSLEDRRATAMFWLCIRNLRLNVNEVGENQYIIEFPYVRQYREARNIKDLKYRKKYTEKEMVEFLERLVNNKNINAKKYRGL